MILLMKNPDEAGEMYIQNCMDWSEYAVYLDRMKKLVHTDLRGLHIFGRRGRLERRRITLHGDGVYIAAILALSMHIPVGIQENNSWDNEFILSTTSKQLMDNSRVFESVNFYTPPETVVLNRSRESIKASALYGILRQGAIRVPGEYIRLYDTVSKIDTNTYETLRKSSFWLYDPHIQVVSAAMEASSNMLGSEDSSDKLTATHNPGVLVTCREAATLIGEHTAAGLSTLAESHTRFAAEKHKVLNALFPNSSRVRMSEREFPLGFCYINYNDNEYDAARGSMTPLWGVSSYAEGEITTEYGLSAEAAEEKNLRTIMVLNDTKYGYSRVRPANPPMRSARWDSERRVYILPRHSATTRSNQQEIIDSTQLSTVSGEVVSEILGGVMEDVGGRTMILTQLTSMGENWDDIKLKETGDLVDMLAARNRVEDPPADNNEYLLEVFGDMRIGQIPTPQGRQMWQSFWTKSYELAEEITVSVLTSTQDVQDTISRALNAVNSMNMQPAQVFGINGTAELGLATTEGWGAVSQKMLEKVAWLIRIDKHLPKHYDSSPTPLKKVLLAKLLLGHAFGSAPRRGIQDFDWMDTRPDINEWHAALGKRLASLMIRGDVSSINAEDCLEFSLRRSMSQYGEVAIRLLRENKLNMVSSGFRSIYEAMGITDMRSHRASMMYRGGMFSVYTPVETIAWVEVVPDSVPVTSSVKAILATVIGTNLMRSGRLDWDLNAKLRGHDEFIFTKVGQHPKRIGELYLAEGHIQEAVANSAPILRMLKDGARQLGVSVSRNSCQELINWPPELRTVEKQRFAGLLNVEMVDDKEGWRGKLGLNQLIPLYLISTIMCVKPELIPEEEIGILRTVLLKMGGGTEESANEVDREADADVWRNLLKNIGNIRIRTNVINDAPEDVVSALLMGEMSVCNNGLVDLD